MKNQTVVIESKGSAPRSSCDGFMASTTKFDELSRGSFSLPVECNALEGRSAQGVTKASLLTAELGRRGANLVAYNSAESKADASGQPRSQEALVGAARLVNGVSLTSAEVERFWSYVDKDGPVCPILGTPHWLWTGSWTRDGYGQFRAGSARDGTRTMLRAHAVSLHLAGVEVPDGQERRHLCGVKRCVNPDHVKVIQC